ncbi:unnamed protein product [Moneuplotes crassus]|uniref:RBR-type E3 ubiquitin transferase n=1 Tax=Euplotes crassus TaxID=5936 RepID=A0AAD1UCD5_EUPCR|nr:unnamed protein product [Moneuplotes crassus]
MLINYKALRSNFTMGFIRFLNRNTSEILSGSISGSTLMKKSILPECPICLDNIKSIDLITTECGHMFHTECMEMHCKSEIDSKSLPIKCPLQKCRKAVHSSQVRNIVEPEVYKKLKRFQVELFVEKNSAFYHFCPSPDCTNVFVWVADERFPSKQDCPACLQTICLKCKTPSHELFTCEEFSEIKDSSPDDIRFHTLQKELKFQQCTQCKFWVEKTQGCNHITCRCKYEFCYVCGGKYNSCKC